MDKAPNIITNVNKSKLTFVDKLRKITMIWKIQIYVIRKIRIFQEKIETTILLIVVYDLKRIRDFTKLSLDIALLPGKGIMACNVMWGNRRIATINSIDLWIHYFHRRTLAIPFPCKPTKENIRDSERMGYYVDIYSEGQVYYLYNPSQISIYVSAQAFFSAVRRQQQKQLFCIICNNVKRFKRHDKTQSLFLCEYVKSTILKRQWSIC